MGERIGGDRSGTAESLGGVGGVGDERLAAAFDSRLSGVWLEVFASGAALSGSMELLGCFLRMA